MAYDISADYVDSTTAYDPRPGPGLDTLSADSAIMANVVTTGLCWFKMSSFILISSNIFFCLCLFFNCHNVDVT
jgi:hypothetical protein